MAERKGIEKLIRPDLVDFGGYSARRSPDTLEGKVEVPVESIIKLDANENLYGCSPRVNQALAAYPEFNIYPDDNQTVLRKLLEGYTGVSAQIGAVIDLVIGYNCLGQQNPQRPLKCGWATVERMPAPAVHTFKTEAQSSILSDVHLKWSM